MHSFSAELLIDSKRKSEMEVGRLGKGLINWKKRYPSFERDYPSPTHVLHSGFPLNTTSGFISTTTFIFYPIVHRSSELLTSVSR